MYYNEPLGSVPKNLGFNNELADLMEYWQSKYYLETVTHSVLQRLYAVKIWSTV